MGSGPGSLARCSALMKQIKNVLSSLAFSRFQYTLNFAILYLDFALCYVRSSTLSVVRNLTSLTV